MQIASSRICPNSAIAKIILTLDCNRELDVTVDLDPASKGHSSLVLMLWRDPPACSGAHLSPGETV